MKHPFFNSQNVLHSCQYRSTRAAWPSEIIWTVTHWLIHRWNNPQWIICTHVKPLIFKMFSHWMNQQASWIKTVSSLCPHVLHMHHWLCYIIHSNSNTTPAEASQAILTLCLFVQRRLQMWMGKVRLSERWHHETRDCLTKLQHWIWQTLCFVCCIVFFILVLFIISWIALIHLATNFMTLTLILKIIVYRILLDKEHVLCVGGES